MRSVVLDTWTASPARFREDANAEEHLAIGYGTRVLAELAANAADAARTARIPGALRVELVGRELRVANTGAPLTAAGVAALASLRASAKRGGHGAVGHFGVGFTAVLALTDEPVVLSTSGGVCFSRSRTQHTVRALQVPGLEAELGQRGGHVPVLRLPWPAAEGRCPPAGFATEVRLPLRDGVDVAVLAESLNAETALDLLWALPELASVTVWSPAGGRRLERRDEGDGTVAILDRPPESGSAGAAVAGSRSEESVDGAERVHRFRTASADGRIPAELLAGRPVEERARDSWRLTWVLPLDADGHPAGLRSSMIGAPTPTEEPLQLPARLVGTLPVDESRSRIAAGPLTDHLIQHAAEAYRALLLAVPGEHRAELVPAGQFPAGPVDAALREAVGRVLERTPFLVGATGEPLTPDHACLVAGLAGLAAARVGEALPGLLDWLDRADRVEKLRAIGVTLEPVARVSAALAQIERPAAWWQPVYQALAAADAEELADLPVPRRGGGTLIGARGVLLPGPGAAPAALLDRAAELVPGLRLAADGADHPLLHRLGAGPADAVALLSDPAMADQVRQRLRDLDDQDPDPADLADFASLVLDLLAAGAPVDPAFLADVLLTDTDGEPWPAGSLLLPDAPLARVLAPDADLPVIDSAWLERHGTDLLARLGVRSGFAVRRYRLPPGDDADLPDVDDWWEHAGSAAVGEETFAAVTDLDLVDDDRWPAALELLAADRDARDALRGSGFGQPYTAWWLQRHARVRGVPPTGWRAGTAVELAGLYDPLPFSLPAEVAAAIGVLQTLEQAAGRPADLLARWSDPARTLPAGRVGPVTGVLVAALAAELEVDLPDEVRVLDGSVLPADRAAVLDQPWAAQALPPGRLVAGGRDPQLIADVLDLQVASGRWEMAPVTGSSAADALLGRLPAAVRCLQFCGRLDLADQPVTVDPGLAVTVDPDPAVTVAGGRVPVRWWVDKGRVLLDGSADGIARAVAHLSGRWADRHALLAAARAEATEQAEAGLD